MKRVLIVFSALSFAAAGAYAQTSPSTPATGATGRTPSGTAMPSHPSSTGIQPTLQSLDKDKDGSISKSEAAPDAGLSRAFVSLDKNKDGKLDASEFASFTGGAGSPTAKSK